MKVQVEKHNYKKDYLNMVQKMLLSNKIRLSDIPKVLRILDVATYLYALRVSRNISGIRYSEDLTIMKSDFDSLNPSKRNRWMHYYHDSVEFLNRKCRVCGCDWNHPCPGGCWWVEEDLCSSCAEKLELINNKAGHKLFWLELLYSDPPIRDKIQIIDPDEEYEVLSKSFQNVDDIEND